MHLAWFIFLQSVLISCFFLIFQDFNLLENNLPDILSNVSYSEFAYCFLMIRLVWGIFEKIQQGWKIFLIALFKRVHDTHRISHMMLSWLSWYLGASSTVNFLFFPFLYCILLMWAIKSNLGSKGRLSAKLMDLFVIITILL